jgi:hypothetical protein
LVLGEIEQGLVGVELEMLRMGAHVLESRTGIKVTHILGFEAEHGCVSVTEVDASDGDLGGGRETVDQLPQAGARYIRPMSQEGDQFMQA